MLKIASKCEISVKVNSLTHHYSVNYYLNPIVTYQYAFEQNWQHWLATPSWTLLMWLLRTSLELVLNMQLSHLKVLQDEKEDKRIFVSGFLLLMWKMHFHSGKKNSNLKVLKNRVVIFYSVCSISQKLLLRKIGE